MVEASPENPDNKCKEVVPYSLPQPQRLPGRGDDLLIIMMGNTGVGKSNFINVAMDNELSSVNRPAPVNHSMEPGTREVNEYIVREKPNKPRIILVDTPGFGNPDFSSDTKILQAVLHWTERGCSSQTAFGGIIYLTTFPQQSEPFLSALTNTQEISLKSVIVDLPNRKDQPKPNEKGMTNDRYHFDNTHDSAWKIIDSLTSNPSPPQLSKVQDGLRILTRGRLGILGRFSQGFQKLLGRTPRFNRRPGSPKILGSDF